MNQNSKQEENFINDQEFDHFFKSQLEHQEITPDDSNWVKIKKWRSIGFLLNVSAKKVLQYAAILLFLLSASTLFFRYSSNTQSTPSVEVLKQPVQKNIVADKIQEELENPSSDFVMDISSKKEEAVSDVKKELIDKELDEYLAFLLEDEDEFAGLIDSIEILKYLEPAEQLPFEDMFAVIPELPTQEEFTILAPLETRITLPHRFVKDGEQIEDFLLLYEINQLRE